jgi:hypothetical protein
MVSGDRPIEDTFFQSFKDNPGNACAVVKMIFTLDEFPKIIGPSNSDEHCQTVADRINSRIIDVAALPDSYIIGGDADGKLRWVVERIIKLTEGATAGELRCISEKLR